MDYIELLKSKVNITNQKYFNWYVNLINKAICRQNECSKEELKNKLSYIENHHILPRCLCDDKDQIKDLNNIVAFTTKEHFIAHYLLAKSTDDYKLIFAVKIMMYSSSNKRYINSRLYEQLKNNIYSAASKIQKENLIKNGHPRKGCKLSNETKKLISLALQGKKQSLETIEKRKCTMESNKLLPNYVHGNTNKRHTDEYKKNMSITCSKIIKSEEWNKKNSESNTGRIHIANIITKQRKRPKKEDAILLLNEPNSNWIALSSQKQIPDTKKED